MSLKQKFTLDTFIVHKIKQDDDFAKHYEREQRINNIAMIIPNNRQEHHMTQLEISKKWSVSSPLFLDSKVAITPLFCH